jgi:hypothetical protein
LNINDLYDFIPDDMHGSIAVSADAVTITQDGDNLLFVLFKTTPEGNADLVLTEAEIPQASDNPTPPPAPRAATEPDAEPQTVDPTPSLIPMDMAPVQKPSVFQRIVNWIRG